MRILTIRTPSLGNSTYLAAHRSTGLLVDPPRDVERFLDVAESEGIAVTHVLETHVHNDYVSGGRDAARRTGADHVLPAGAGVGFPHVPAFHFEDFEAEGDVSIRPIHTPGHTPEHVSYLVLVEGRAVALFSGGSLLLGSAGRTDLLGGHLAHQLARLQFGSLRRLAELEDDVALLPTHGAGSFCTAAPAGRASSTIGTERRQNPLLAAEDADAFVALQSQGLMPYPAYYPNMAPINRAGPRAMPVRAPPVLDPDTFLSAAERATVVDARARHTFAQGHVPGSLGIELSTSFATWVGWLVPFAEPLLFVVDEAQQGSMAAAELARIGFDEVVGMMLGVEEWRASGRPLDTIEVVSETEALAAAAQGSTLLDVRDPAERAAGPLEGSLHRYVPDLVDGVPSEAEQDVIVMCRTGYRAEIAASLLQRQGFPARVVLSGGVPGMLRSGAVG
jgi:glyoxylase-like metal-dependent hydrolase (beta-lactamase superfamily II)/rhodanese-related sulfurtransferase